MYEIIVRLVPLPRTIQGFTVPDENMDYNIYLNEKLSDQEKAATLWHELGHIEHGDFWDDTRTVAEKEYEARHDNAEKDTKRKMESPGVPGTERWQSDLWFGNG